jgi:hypothetical protein
VISEAWWRDLLTLPASAVVTEGDVNVGYKSFCYVIEQGRANRTEIEIGARNNVLVEVLKKRVSGKSGNEAQREEFTGSEDVVDRGLSGLKDGQPIESAPSKK